MLQDVLPVHVKVADVGQQMEMGTMAVVHVSW